MIGSSNTPAGKSKANGKLAAVLMFVAVAASSGAVSGGAIAYLLKDDGPAQISPSAAPATVATPSPAVDAADVPAVIAQVKQSVVSIEADSTVRIGPRPATQKSFGTGIVLTSDGMIATNAHVIEDARVIMVTLPGGDVVSATLVGFDSESDLAVLHVERTELKPMSLGRSADLQVGDSVIAIGNALGLEGGLSASMGIVSALDRTIDTNEGRRLSRLIQTDAAINEGDSGGPLTNRKGELVGINSVGSNAAENIGFAISIDQALPILGRLVTGQ